MKKKGFTLIELLAVIVILAVIALIVTPIVTGIIKSAKEQANARSVEGHISNVEYAISSKILSTGKITQYDITNDILSEDISVPSNDTIVCSLYTIKSGKVMEAKYCKDNSWNKVYSYSTSGGAYSLDFNGTYVAAQAGETHKGIVYLDPSDISRECNEDSEITTTNTGCKKFYIYNDTGDNYTMIMDRNTTAFVAWANHDDYIAAGGTEEDWNSSRYNTQGPVTVTKKLKEDTANWIGSPRLIKQSEVRTITGNNGTSSYYFGSNNNTTSYADQTDAQKAIQQSYHWLFDYTLDCTSYGCQTANSSTYGYWTSDAVSGISYAWSVSRYGLLSINFANYDTNYGVRPVISISKSLLGN